MMRLVRFGLSAAIVLTTLTLLGCGSRKPHVCKAYNDCGACSWCDKGTCTRCEAGDACATLECIADVEPPAAVLINELAVNSVGDDTASLTTIFAELYGPAAQSLDGFVLVGVRRDGTSYGEVTLDGQSLDGNGMLVIAHPNAEASLVALAGMTSPNVDYEDGPGSVQLRFLGVVVDAVGYGTFEAGDVLAGEGRSAAQPGEGQSLTRDAAHADTGDNSVDFTVSGAASPASPGRPEPTMTAPVVITQAKSDRVSLSWSALEGATGYRVLWSASAGGPYTEVGTTTQATYDDTSAPLGQTSYYVVRALYQTVEGPTSNEVKALPGRLLCVLDDVGDSITTVDAFADGDATPLRVLGNQTGLRDPRSVVYDPSTDELLVLNNRSITAFRRSAAGNYPPERTIGTEGVTWLPSFLSGGGWLVLHDGEVYQAEDLGVVSVYPAAQNGYRPPTRRLQIPTDVSNSIVTMGIDAEHEELIVATQDDDIRFYPLHFTSETTLPAWTLVSAELQASQPRYIVARKGEVLVLAGDRILVFKHPEAADCDSARVCSLTPVREITITGASRLNRLMNDPRTDRLFVFFYSGSLYSDPTIAELSAAQVAAGGSQVATMHALDRSVLDIVWIPGATADQDGFASLGWSTVDVYHNNSAGGWALDHTIGNPHQDQLHAFAVDRDSGAQYVTLTPYEGVPALYQLSLDSTNVSTPVRVYDAIAAEELEVSANKLVVGLLDSNTVQTYWLLDAQYGLLLDRDFDTADGVYDLVAPTASRYYWALYERSSSEKADGAVLAYDGRLDDTGEPTIRIEGLSTGLDSPHGLAVDLAGGEVFVGDSGTRILVFDIPPTAGTFDIAPQRVLNWSRTYPGGLVRLLIDHDNAELYVMSYAEVAVFPLKAEGNAAPLRVIPIQGSDMDFCR